jgi:hypothetical protein
MENTTKKINGLNLLMIISLIFFTLKEFKIINWDWYWLLFPLLFPIIIGLIITISMFLFYFLKELISINIKNQNLSIPKINRHKLFNK